MYQIVQVWYICFTLTNICVSWYIFFMFLVLCIYLVFGVFLSWIFEFIVSRKFGIPQILHLFFQNFFYNSNYLVYEATLKLYSTDSLFPLFPSNFFLCFLLQFLLRCLQFTGFSSMFFTLLSILSSVFF